MKAVQILDQKKIYALIGASNDMLKYSYELLFTLLDAGYTVYPINTKYSEIENQTCYPDLQTLPQKPEVVLVVLAPPNTEKIVEHVIAYDPEVIWIPPGSWTEAAVKTCEAAGKQVLYNVCPIGTLRQMGKIK